MTESAVSAATRPLRADATDQTKHFNPQELPHKPCIYRHAESSNSSNSILIDEAMP